MPVTTRPPVLGLDVWRGDELQHDSSWIVDLDRNAIAEIDTLLQNGPSALPFAADQFPFDSCQVVIDNVIRRLERGPGIALVRGLPRDRYTTEQCELIYWAFAVHLGTPVSQNSQGHLIGHVRDQGKSIDDPNVRVYQTNAKLDYHADQLPVDVLGLFCLRTAKEGGESKIVSATAIHNVIREERPDLLDVLFEPFNLDWRGEEPVGEAPWYRLPMFSTAGGLVTSRFTSLAYFRTVGRHGSELALTPLQTEALEAVQEIANRPGMALSMAFEEGDMQFLNNHVMLHARESYVDHPEPERRRHLLRLWVASPEERRRPLSPLLAERYHYVEMGGIPAKN